jgi:hypothetical protein
MTKGRSDPRPHCAPRLNFHGIVGENISPVAPMQRARALSRKHYAQKSTAAVDDAQAVASVEDRADLKQQTRSVNHGDLKNLLGSEWIGRRPGRRRRAPG